MPRMRSARARDVASLQRLIDWTSLRRTGKPIEVAYGVLFLASDEASFITGTETGHRWRLHRAIRGC